MQNVADQSVALTTIRADLCAIFISLELEPINLAGHIAVPRPGREDVQAQRVRVDIAALLARFRSSGGKHGADRRILPDHRHSRSGAGRLLDLPCLLSEGIESHVVDAASIATSRRRRRAKTDRIDGEALLRALLAHKRGEPRVCSMVRAPTPEDEDRRRICRERKVLIMERVQQDLNEVERQ